MHTSRTSSDTPMPTSSWSFTPHPPSTRGCDRSSYSRAPTPTVPLSPSSIVRRRLVRCIFVWSKTAGLDLQYQRVDDPLLSDDDVRKGLSVALEPHEAELEIDHTIFQ